MSARPEGGFGDSHVLGWPRPQYGSGTDLDVFRSAPVLLRVLLAGLSGDVSADANKVRQSPSTTARPSADRSS